MTLDLDGWSNIHNEPTICASVITEYSQSFLVETIDTSGNKYHTNYLTQLCKQIISRTTEKFGLKLGSYVTDNAANMNEMRTELSKSDDTDTGFRGALNWTSMMPRHAIFLESYIYV